MIKRKIKQTVKNLAKLTSGLSGLKIILVYFKIFEFKILDMIPL
jgi:hypothetical protein